MCCLVLDPSGMEQECCAARFGLWGIIKSKCVCILSHGEGGEEEKRRRAFQLNSDSAREWEINRQIIIRSEQSFKQKHGPGPAEKRRRLLVFHVIFGAETCFYVTIHKVAANELKYQNLLEMRDQTNNRESFFWTHICGSLRQQRLLMPPLITGQNTNAQRRHLCVTRAESEPCLYLLYLMLNVSGSEVSNYGALI